MKLFYIKIISENCLIFFYSELMQDSGIIMFVIIYNFIEEYFNIF